MFLVVFLMSALFSTLILIYMAVPTEQSLTASFPNVIIASGFGGGEVLDAISFDNNTLPSLTDTEAASLNGLFQYDPLFYHKSLDNLVPWDERDTVRVTIWSCTMFCRPVNTTSRDTKLALVHKSPTPKMHMWLLAEFRDDDANSPIIYARSKVRKAKTYRVPWVTMTPGGEVKPRELEKAYLLTAWDAFRFDTPVKWVTWVAIIASTVAIFKFRGDDD